MKNINFIIILLLVTFGFAHENKTTVSLQLQWLHQFQFAGYYIAKEKGFYSDADIDVDIKEYKFGMNISKDVTSGKIDFGVGRSSLVLDKINGMPIIMMAAIYQNSPFVLLSKKRDDIKKSIRFKKQKNYGYN